MSDTRRPVVGLVAVIAAAALFGLNGTVSKLALSTGLTAERLVQIRAAGAATCLLVAASMTRPHSLRAGPREAAFLVGAGVVGIALVQWLYFIAIDRLPVGVALLLEFQAPVLIALYVWIVRREPVRSRLWAALACSVVGLIVIAKIWQGLRFDGLGVVAALLSAVALAVYYLTGERGLTRRDPLSLAAWTFSASAVFWAAILPWWTFPFGSLTESARVGKLGAVTGLTVPVWALVGYVVVLGTVVPYTLVLVGIRHLGPARTSLAGMTEPVLAGLMAWLVLGERLTVVQLIGAGVVLAGIALAETARVSAGSPDEQVVLPTS
ncbi:MAG: EamA family transporter [Actinomycetota bacterium]